MMEELPDHLSFSDPTVREAIEIVSRACKRTAEDLEKERTTGKPTEVRGAQIALEAVGTNVVYEQD